MSSIETELLREISREAEAILKEAENKAQEIIREAEETWKRNYENYKKNELDKIVKLIAQQESDAKLKGKAIVDKTKSEIISKVFNDAIERIKRREFDVEKSLKNLLSEGLSEIERPIKVVASSRDADVVNKVLNELGLGNIEVEFNEGMLGGIIIHGSDMVVDNSYETRIERIKEKFIKDIVVILWGETG